MEKEEAALTVTEHQPVWPRCTFHLRRGNGTHAKFKEILTLRKILKCKNTRFDKNTFTNMPGVCVHHLRRGKCTNA